MNDELTSRLSRQLHEQVDGWQTAPLTLEGVQGRARSIRRTRRVAAGAVVAAVFAIVVPVGIVTGGVFDASPDRDVPPANNPTEAVEQDPSAIGVPYLEGRTLTMPDGAQTELPRAYDGATVLGDLVLATTIDTDDGSATLDRIEGGEVVGSEELSGMGLAPNADGSAVAYVRADGQLVVEGVDGQVEVAEVGQAQPVALVGDCQSDDCTVFLDQGGTPVAVSGSGEVTALPGDPLAVEDASAVTGRVAMLMSVDDFEPGSCSRVVDELGAGSQVFKTCDVMPTRFSPGGSYLSAGPEYGDGHGATMAAILDAETGEELARFEPPDGSITQAIWEDPQHLLLLTYHWSAREWSVVRLAADGTTGEALGPVAGGEMNPPWQLLGPS